MKRDSKDTTRAAAGGGRKSRTGASVARMRPQLYGAGCAPSFLPNLNGACVPWLRHGGFRARRDAADRGPTPPGRAPHPAKPSSLT